jgi:hypothetical protein
VKEMLKNIVGVKKPIMNLVIIVLFSFPSIGFAETYWVSPAGRATWTTCQSPADPGSNYCSLKTANNNATAGDTVYLKGGTYTVSDTEYGRYGGAVNPARSGTVTNKITYAAAAGETPTLVQTAGSYIYGLRLGDPVTHAYIKVDGITFSNFASMAYITNYSNHNEITNCTFKSDTGREGGGFVMMPLCPGGNSFKCNVTHNWIHHNVFSKAVKSEVCGGSEGSDLFRLGPACCGTDADGECNYNTLEDNLFEYGGHSTLETFGRFLVIRNNVFHNEPWVSTSYVTGSPCDYPATNYTNPAYNGYYGHRNLETADDWVRPAIYNLIEGNRFGYASTNPNNAGATNYEVSAPKQIIRYNYFYGAMNMGLYFKYGSGAPGTPGKAGGGGWGGVYNRVFNNTMYHNGYGYPFYETCRHSNCPEDLAGIVVGGSSFGNIVKNNLAYDNRSYYKYGADIILRGGHHPIPSNIARVVNNWQTSKGDPKFVNPDLTNTKSRTLPDLTLQSSSRAIDGGTHLTEAKGSGNNSTTLVVNDALYFQDGTWGSDLARSNLHADWIAIGTVTNAVQIYSVNYDTNTINLKSPMKWSNGAKIWLYKKSDGAHVLYSSAPDFGAYEFNPGGN